MIVRGAGLLVLGVVASCAAEREQPGPGAGEAEPGLEQLRIDASVEGEAGGVRGIARIHNVGPGPAVFGIAGGCATALVIYQGENEVWDQGRSHPTGCKWLPNRVRLEEGQSHETDTGAVPVAAILGDSLAAGRYAARVRILLARLVPTGEDGAFTSVIDSVVVVPAGEVALDSGGG